MSLHIQNRTLGKYKIYGAGYQCRIKYILTFILSLFLVVSPGFTQQIIRLPQAHSHNDYNHKRPLYDALDQGFTNIEADVFLVGDELFVAHDPDDIHPSGTLRSLYLNPLHRMVQDTTGKYFSLFPVSLLVDIKSDALPAYLVLQHQLESYGDMISSIEGDSVNERAVTVLVSGNRPVRYIEHQETRLAFIDGRPGDIDEPAILFPWISTSLQSLYNGKQPLDSVESVLRNLALNVHRQHKKLRLWGTPDTESWWEIQLQSGLDLIGTDHPAALKTFLLYHH